MSDLNLYSVNWQDGMLITQQHLRDQEQYCENLARWYALHAGDRYGLVRKSTSGTDALRMNYTVSGSNVRVEVTECHALMPDGSIVSIEESYKNTVSSEITAGETNIPVYLGINRLAKKQIGDPDPRDDIPRIPYLVNEYTLYLGQQPDLPEAGFLQIADLVIVGDDIQLNEEYFPPSLTLHALDRLSDKARDYRNRLENLLSLTSRAYAAVSTGGALGEVKTDLQIAFKDTVYLLGYQLSSTLDDFVVGRNAYLIVLL